jgi:hypothetical protein
MVMTFSALAESLDDDVSQGLLLLSSVIRTWLCENSPIEYRIDTQQLSLSDSYDESKDPLLAWRRRRRLRTRIACFHSPIVECQANVIRTKISYVSVCNLTRQH